MGINSTDKLIEQKGFENQFSRDTRIRANFLELAIGSDGNNLSEQFKPGGTLLDFGCGDGELGQLLSQRHQMTLVQSDMVDRRINKSNPYIQVDYDKVPDFGQGLNGVIDTILLVDVFDKVIYKDNNPIDSKLDLLRRCTPLLTESGKIAIVANSPTATSEVSMELMQKVKTLALNDEQLKDKVAFFSPDEKKNFHLVVEN